MDFATNFAAGQAAVGDPVASALNTQMGLAQMQGLQIQNAQAAQTMALQRVALARQQQYTSDVQSFASNPTVEGLATLWKYPEFQANTKGIYDAMDPRMRQSEATQLGSFAAVLQNAQNKDGTYDPKMLNNAAQMIQQRIDADQAAGRDTSNDEMALQMVQSGDPKQINALKAMTAGLIAGAAGFDKASDYLKSIGLSQEPIKTTPGDTYTNPLTGQTPAAQPSNLQPETLNIPGGAQELVGFNPNPGATNGASTEGGGPASTGAGGAQNAVAHVLSNEGGFNPKDANGSPTNYGINFKANRAVLAKMGITAANFKNLTQDQAAQIYATKYWPQSGADKLAPGFQAPYFDVYVRSPAIAKAALAQSGGDPVKFMQIANAKFQAMASNPNSGTAPYKSIWAKRDAGNMALVAGSSSAPNGSSTVAPSSVGGQTGVIATTASPGALNTQGAPPGWAWNSTHSGLIPVPNGPEDISAYSPQMIDDLTGQFAATGQMQGISGGMGGGGGMAALKKAIATHLPAWLAARGMTAADLPGFRAKVKADTGALNAVNGTLNGLQAASDALTSDGQAMIRAQQPLVKMGIIHDGALPSLNEGSIEANWHAATGPQAVAIRNAIKAYKDAVNAYAMTYSKFMTAANGVGGSAAPSDSAREAAGELNDLGMGPSALQSHVHQVGIEAGNRVNGFVQQRDAILKRMNGYMQPRNAQGAVQISNVAQYNSLPSGTQYIDPNGVKRTKR